MVDIRFSRDDVSGMEQFFPENAGCEGKFYYYDVNSRRMIIKIINDLSNKFTKIGLGNIKILSEYRELFSERLSELVLPDALVYIDDIFMGFIMEYIQGVGLKTFLRDDSISLNDKFGVLEKIGVFLDKKNSLDGFPYSFWLGDLHEDNIIVTEDNGIRIVDSNGVCLERNKVPNCKYLVMGENILDLWSDKYKTDAIVDFIPGRVIPSDDSDIYCYGVILMNFISKTKYGLLSYREVCNYLDYLDKIEFSPEFLDSIRKLYSNGKNENPCRYLSGITEEMMEKASYKVYKKEKI